MINAVNSKIGKLIVVFGVLLSTIVSLYLPVNAQAATEKEDSYFTNLQTNLENNGLDAFYQGLNLSDVNNDFSLFSQTEKGQEFNTLLNEQNFLELNVKNPYNIRLISKKDGSIATDVVYKFYENTAGDKVMIQLVVDKTNNEINHVAAQKVSNGENRANTIFEESAATLYSKKITPRKNFSFNGKSFACSMTGLLTCSSYCVVWGLVNIAAGLTCEAVCGTAMAAVCSTT